MVFMSLYESLQRGELLMIDGGLCQFRLRKDGQLTIHVLLSNRKGAGFEMLSLLKNKNAKIIVAKCPIEYAANEWYKRQGFSLGGIEGKVNIWKLEL